MFWLLIMAIWTNESGVDYNRAGAAAPSYLSAPEQERFERLRQCRILFEGKHRRYFLDEERTQYRYPIEVIEGRRLKRYVTYNLLKLISNTTADLLFAAKAKIEAPSPQQTNRLDELARRSLLHARLHQVGVQTSWAGGGFLESMLYRGEAYLTVVEADAIYPVGIIGPDGQYAEYIRYATANIGSAESPVILLLETRYLEGAIVRKLWQLNDEWKRGVEIADLTRWPSFAGGDVKPEQRTGLDVNTITYIPNIVSDRWEVSDYDGLVEMQDTVNAKVAQAARVIEKHSTPKFRAPRSAAKNGTLSASSEVYFSDKADDYGYLTWDAQLEPAFRDREAAVMALCTEAEMSPVLLGIRQGATPDAARKLRLEATKDLAKAGRKSLLFEPAIARAIETTQRLDQSTPLLRSYPIEPIGVHVRDGLPVDGLDLATEASTWAGAGLMSIEDGVSMRIEDPDAAAAEVARIKKQKAESMPSTLLDEPTGANTPAIDAGDQGNASETPNV